MYIDKYRLIKDLTITEADITVIVELKVGEEETKSNQESTYVVTNFSYGYAVNTTNLFY